MSKIDYNVDAREVPAISLHIMKKGLGDTEVEEVPKERKKMLMDSPEDIEPSFIREIKDNHLIRFKLTLSVLVTLAFMVLGWTMSQLGPAFPDLVEITDTDLNRGSGLMTSYFTGRLVGSGLGGILYSKMNAYLMFVLSLVINGTVIAVIPWCFQYKLMITAHALHGISGGVLNVAVTSTAMSIWGPTKRGRSYVQIMYAFFAVSSTLAPIATAPFLKISNSNDQLNFSTTSVGMPAAGPGNVSYLNNTYKIYNLTDGAALSDIDVSESNIYIAYSISAGMAFAVAIPFMILYATRRSESSTKSRTEEQKFLGNLSRIANYIQIINVGLFAAVYGASDLLFVTYLTIFCVQHLQWTKTSGALLTSVVVLATLGSRFIGIFLVRVMKSYNILLLCIIIYTCGFICMTITSQLFADIAIWISVCIIGLPSGVIWPTALSWINSYLIPVGGRVSSYLLVTAYLGPLLCPSLLGYLMQEVSLLWFCYLCVILSGINVINVIIMVIHTLYSKRYSN